MKEVKNIELTKEIREKISEYCAIDVDGTFEYTPVAYKDLPEKFQPIFTMRYLDGIEDLQITKMHTVIQKDSKEPTIDWSKFPIAVCQAGIISWSNYYTISGKKIKYNKKCKGLPKALIYELCLEIQNGEKNKLDTGEKMALV